MNSLLNQLISGFFEIPQQVHTHWCHICQRECTPVRANEDVQCPTCQSPFIEEIERNEQHPRAFQEHRHSNNMPENQNQPQANGNGFNTIRIVRSSSGGPSVLHYSYSSGPITNFTNPNNGLGMLMNNLFNNPLNGMGSFLFRHNNDNAFENLLNYLMVNDPNRHGNPPASKQAVQELHRDFVNEHNNERFKGQECAVCKDSFEISNKVAQMPCSHVFHDDCLTPWLDMHNSCPVCRHELKTDDPDYESRKNAHREHLRNMGQNANNNQN